MVHNHDYDPTCREHRVDGRLVGECMQPSPAQPPADPHPRGRETSKTLTEVRTVLSHAENAIETLEQVWAYRNRPAEEDSVAQQFGRRYLAAEIDDPETIEMLGALRDVVARLDRWRRTGRPLKGGRK